MSLYSSESILASSRLSMSRFSNVPKVCVEDGKNSLVEVADLHRSPTGCKATFKSFLNHKTLQDHLRNPLDQNVTARIFLLRQNHSWGPIQATYAMLNAIWRKYDALPEFWDLCSCFRERDGQTEEGFCLPVRSRHSQSSYEICYTYRYAEKKPQKTGHPWRIRQTGLYHRFDFATRRSVFVIISPIVKSRLEQNLMELLTASWVEKSESLANPMLLHHMLISTHLPDAREYLLYFEEVLEPIWRTATTSSIDEPLRLNYDSLSKVRYLESRFLPLEAMFNGVLRLVQGLDTMEKVLCDRGSLDKSMTVVLQTSLSNFTHETSAYKENALHLIQRTRNTGQVVSDILNFKNQATAQEQNRHMSTLARSTTDDSVNVRVITLVTLFYLPFSFIATVLSMEFFSFDASSQHITASSQLWIYFALAIPLTALTLMFWKWKTWMHNKQRRIGSIRSGMEWELYNV